MKVVHSVGALRRARADMGVTGLVPTMGSLHRGHISLVEHASADNDAVAVSIFVNPTQFGPNEDLTKYPRSLPHDLAMLESAGVALVFAPEPADIYPPGFASSIDVGRIGKVLEGAARPGHFAGVATVVAKLINLVQPSYIYMGQKDAQQCVVVKAMVRDLDMTVQVVVCPTVREGDGLAMSSRNMYLTPEQRIHAPALYRGLRAAEMIFGEGERRAIALRAAVLAEIDTVTRFEMDYISVADAHSLEEVETVRGPAIISLAARLGSTRLIDNVIVETD
jgi:pantoate--beta-alanine ligase